MTSKLNQYYDVLRDLSLISPIAEFENIPAATFLGTWMAEIMNVAPNTISKFMTDYYQSSPVNKDIRRLEAIKYYLNEVEDSIVKEIKEKTDGYEDFLGANISEDLSSSINKSIAAVKDNINIINNSKAFKDLDIYKDELKGILLKSYYLTMNNIKLSGSVKEAAKEEKNNIVEKIARTEQLAKKPKEEVSEMQKVIKDIDVLTIPDIDSDDN